MTESSGPDKAGTTSNSNEVRSATDFPNLIPLRLGVGQAWWIAAAPAFGYALSFAYESGFVGRFNVPFWVIRPDISHVLFALTSAGVVLFFIHSVLLVLPSRPWWLFIIPTFGVVAGLSVALAFLIGTKWYWGTHLIVPLIGMALGIAFAVSYVRDYLITPLKTYSHLPRVWDRWKARTFRDRGKPASDAFQGILTIDRSGRIAGWYALLLVAGFCTFLAHAAGGISAQGTADFAFSYRPSPCIVIRRYGENLVCASIDTSHSAVLDSFSILTLSDSVTLSMRHFARLQFPDDRKKGYLFGGP
jgi:hypothetical protein